MKGVKFIGLLLGTMLMAGCENSTFQNSVPAYPVHVVIDTRMGDFVHFQREIVGDYVIVTPSGYFHKDKLVQPLLATDRCGYGGVIVYVSMLQDYCAFDLACPNCAQKSLCRPCLIDGLYGVCPECGEQYDISSGTAAPQRGIAHETLRPLSVNGKETGKLVISQKR